MILMLLLVILIILLLCPYPGTHWWHTTLAGNIFTVSTLMCTSDGGYISVLEWYATTTFPLNIGTFCAKYECTTCIYVVGPRDISIVIQVVVLWQHPCGETT